MSEFYIKEKDRFDRADQVGISAAKTIITLSAGGLLALLTFLGNASSQSIVTVPLFFIKVSIFSFLLAILTMLLGLFASYIMYASPPENSLHNWLDRKIILINSSMAIIGLLSFATGVTAIACGAEPAVP